MEADAEILEPFELRYSDLVLLSFAALSAPHASIPAANTSSSASSASPQAAQEVRRLEALRVEVMEALGSSGPGLLCITEVPKGPSLRQALLPLARKLALLGGSDRSGILKDHGLGTDVPLKDMNRTVSSFALQLKYQKDTDAKNGFHEKLTNNKQVSVDSTVNHGNSIDNHFEGLGSTFKDLGLCMMDLGLRIAQVCDRAIGGQELEDSILESFSAKGRLIHYHSYLDNHILKNTMKKGKGSKGQMPKPSAAQIFSPAKAADKTNTATETPFQVANASILPLSQKPNTTNALNFCRVSLSNLWQQWHYDYGTFTVLTAPMFLSSDAPTNKVDDHYYSSSSRECDSPDGHSYLQLLDINKNKIFLVKSPPESFVVQVGESADILSKGKLRSTLHSVCRPANLENISREMFVVFLQPSWGKILKTSEFLSARDMHTDLSANGVATVLSCDKDMTSRIEVYGPHDFCMLKNEILRSIPPLASRIKDGMTFAEFSRETTRQYYGGSGTQPRNKATHV